MKRTKSTAPAATDYDLLRLDNQLCFALYAATRAVTKAYRERLDEMGITYPQYLVLIVLWEQDGVTLKEIGERLLLDSGTLTPLLKRLERQNLVRRARDSDDEREVHITLTRQGKKMRDAALDARRHVGCRLRMSEKEILALRREIMALIDTLAFDCQEAAV